jgi:hypothetical protein
MPRTSTRKQTTTAKRALDFASKSSPASSQQLLNRDATTTAAVSSPKRLKTALSTTTVTPEEAHEKLPVAYVPTYIHKNLLYLTRDKAALSDATRAAYDLIKEQYIVPSDLERMRSFGPLSGSSYEERVIQQYALGALESKCRPPIAICIACAHVGHMEEDCPTLI